MFTWISCVNLVINESCVQCLVIIYAAGAASVTSLVLPCIGNEPLLCEASFLFKGVLTHQNQAVVYRGVLTHHTLLASKQLLVVYLHITLLQQLIGSTELHHASASLIINRRALVLFLYIRTRRSLVLLVIRV